MKTKKILRFLLALIFGTVIFLFAQPTSLSQAAPERPQLNEEFVDLIIQNESSTTFSIRLNSVNEKYTYYLTVPPHTTKGFWMRRARYKTELYYCGYTRPSNMNLKIYQVLFVPECGGNWVDKQSPHYSAASHLIRPIPIQIRNDTGIPTAMHMYTGDGYVYHALVQPGEIRSFAVLQDDYKVYIDVCGDIPPLHYYAKIHTPLVLQCTDGR